MTLSPCRTLQNVIQTQKCVLCLEYAKPNRCVFKCFANVSKPKEEDLKSTGKAFQLLGPATAKDLKPQSVRWLGTTMSPWAADLKADRPGTKEVMWWLLIENDLMLLFKRLQRLMCNWLRPKSRVENPLRLAGKLDVLFRDRSHHHPHHFSLFSLLV